MNKEDKNKLKSKTKSKILVLGFVLLALVGLFGYGEEVNAEECFNNRGELIPCPPGPINTPPTTPAEEGICWNEGGGKPILAKDSVECFNLKGTWTTVVSGKAITAKPPLELEEIMGCNIAKPGTYFRGCLIRIFYVFFVQIPSGILWIAAKIFNTIMHLILQSKMYSDPFLNGAWTIVRDFSNIFFILILLYVAIKTVLNMGGHETKSMITSVIIMAVLINFSMFFTNIVIDSSNILANIFYNKLDVTYKDANGNIANRPNPDEAKDIAGTMYEKFNMMKLMSPEFIGQLKIHSVKDDGLKVPSTSLNTNETTFSLAPKSAEAGFWVPFIVIGSLITGITGINYVTASDGDIAVGPMLVIMLVSGAVLLVAAYTFFTSGIFFIGRLIELWVLIIFSPFAFMSFALPKLAHTEYGWDKWFEKLISTAFMAPIFMFFMYLIFLILESSIFKSAVSEGAGTDIVQTLFKIILPAMIIIGLLLKAKDLAKIGGGQIGEMVMTGTKMVGGFALGAATGGAAMAATGTLGKAAMSIASNDKLKQAAAGGDRGAQRKLAFANSMANKSFDFRDTGLGKFASKKSGLDLSTGTGAIGLGQDKFKEGRKGVEKQEAEREDKTRQTYMMSGRDAQEHDEKIKPALKNWGKDRDSVQEEINKGKDAGTMDSKEEARLLKSIADAKPKNSTEINKDRQTAYGASLEEQNTQSREEAYEKGDIKGRATSNAIAGGLAGFALAGPVGAGIGALSGGIVGAIKELKEPMRAWGRGIIKNIPGDNLLVNALKDVIRPQATSDQTPAMVVKGVTGSVEKALSALNAAVGIKPGAGAIPAGATSHPEVKPVKPAEKGTPPTVPHS